MADFSSLRVAVIGAGLAGISAAQSLRSHQITATVFEKSRGFGGRCATKRWEGQTLDHGAQYFTLRDEGFRQQVTSACGDRIQELAAPILTENRDPLHGQSRYYHLHGNSRLVRELAKDLDVRTDFPVTSIQPDGSGWRIGSEVFDRIISTAPLPQTRVLAGLPTESSPYLPCLTLLLLYSGEWIGLSRERYAVSDASGHPLAWSACENHKRQRVASGLTAFVVQASREFSESNLEASPETWAVVLRELVEERWQLPRHAFRAQLPHRWRYARISQPQSPPDLPVGWEFGGDALTDSRVESAWLAGEAAARRLIQK